MLHFSLCNKERLAIGHMNRPLFPTTLSISSYDIGKYVGIRTYQHPLVNAYFMPRHLHDKFTHIIFFCDSRFIFILINSVCIENSAFQAVPEIKNTLVGHFSELCVFVHACIYGVLHGTSWYFYMVQC